MSLINQMLQELDARRSEVEIGMPYGQQVKAVPARRQVHPAWWIVAALVAVLLALVGWLFVRPAMPALQSTAPNQTAAKRESKHDEHPALVSGAQAAPDKVSTPEAVNQPVAVAELPPAPAVTDIRQTPAVQENVPNTAVQAPSPEAKQEPVRAAPLPVIKEASPRPAESNNLTPLAKDPAAMPATSTSESSATVVTPVVVNKQMKELTPQQRSENEYRKALMAVQQGRSTEGIAGLEQALEIDASNQGARQALIGVLLDNKRTDEALRRTRDGLALDLAQPGLAMIAARLQLEKGELRAAIDTLGRTMPYAVERPDYHAFLAALLQRDERHKQATEHYFQALQKAPQNGVWWMGVGISLQADQRAEEALQAFRRAKASNSLSPELLSFVNARIDQLQH